eukprot:TRINITY_DN7133_c0_g1_i1.p1 TRINITY_DN7133_c0_g1~~TRINITY_DN7133_c0_g1_i1.p1  ORF type:complete len:624 (+),score=205.19 TRINITY_DN7133_c0_g1_i1:138-2009(+)
MGHNVGGRTSVDHRASGKQDMPSMAFAGGDGGNVMYMNAMQQQMHQLAMLRGAGMVVQQPQAAQSRCAPGGQPMGYWGGAMDMGMAQLATHQKMHAQPQMFTTSPAMSMLAPAQQLPQQQQQQQQFALNGVPTTRPPPAAVNRALVTPVPHLLDKIDRAEQRIGGVNPLAAVVGDISTWGITVTDPLEKRKVACPTCKIAPTNGLVDSSSKAHTHSICILYQNYKCKVDQNCNQIHVDRQFYTEQRKGTPCCAEHHDLFTQTLLSQQVVVLPRIILVATHRGVRTPYLWPTEHVSLSLGLSRCDVRIIDGVETIIVEDNRVCQVWQCSRCTYGKECNYVHLCRAMYELIPRDTQHRANRASSSRNPSAGPSLSSTPSGRIPIANRSMANGSMALTPMMSTGSNSSFASSCVLGGATPPSGGSHLTQLTPPPQQLQPAPYSSDTWVSVAVRQATVASQPVPLAASAGRAAGGGPAPAPAAEVEEEEEEDEEWEEDEESSESEKEDLKMTLIVRKDLKMGAGKMCAQCCHAAVGCLEKVDGGDNATWKHWKQRWRRIGCAKVALKCESEQDLLDVQAKAKKEGVPTYLVRDAGRTQIASGSKTVLGVGPAPLSKVNSLTGKFKLL